MMLRPHTPIKVAACALAVALPLTHTGAQPCEIARVDTTDNTTRYGVYTEIKDDLLIVGADFDPDRGLQAGAAYIYRTPDGGSTWNFEQKIYGNDTDERDQFGMACAIQGDRAVISAPRKRVTDIESGPLGLPIGPTAGVTSHTLNVSTAYTAITDIAVRLSISHPDISSLSVDLVHVNSGTTVRLFDRACPGRANLFGRFVNGGDPYDCVAPPFQVASAEPLSAFNGLDPNSDWRLDVTDHVGGNTGTLNSWEFTGPFRGAAYVFQFDGAQWVETQQLLPANAFSPVLPFPLGDSFGSEVTMQDDLLVLGAWWTESTGPRAGAAYVYRWDGTQYLLEDTLFGPDQFECDQFGIGVAISGDVLAIGAPGHMSRGAVGGRCTVEDGIGAVYIYRYNPLTSTWDFEQKVMAADGLNDDRLGDYVCIDGDRVLASAIGDSHENGDLAGSLYLFERDPGTGVWLETEKFLPDPFVLDAIYGACAIEGDTIVAGACGEDDFRGAAYVHRFDGVEWVREARFAPPSIAEDWCFAHVMSMQDGIVAFGTLPFFRGGFQPGSVFVYDVRENCACPCETDGVPGIDVFDLLAFLDDWFADAADFDGNGMTDVFDLLDFLGCWFTGSGNPDCAP